MSFAISTSPLKASASAVWAKRAIPSEGCTVILPTAMFPAPRACMNANDDGSRGNWTNTSASVDKKVRGVVHLMLTSPAFHLA